MEYYHIMSAVTDAAYPAKAWDSEFRRVFPCLHRPTEEPLDVTLRALGEPASLTFVGGAGVHIAREDLLQTLGPAADRYLLFGQVFDETGKRIEGLKTLGSSQTFQLRGGPKSTRQFCVHCGQFLYFPMGQRYLLRSQLTGQPLYYSRGLIGLVINHDLYERFAGKKLESLYISPLPIRDKPLDGLPAVLDHMDAETLQQFGGIIRPG